MSENARVGTSQEGECGLGWVENEPTAQRRAKLRFSLVAHGASESIDERLHVAANHPRADCSEEDGESNERRHGKPEGALCVRSVPGGKHGAE